LSDHVSWLARLKAAWLAIPAAAFLAMTGDAARADEGICGGRRYELRTLSNGASPYIEFAAPGVSGVLLLDYGSTKSWIVRGPGVKEELTANLLLSGLRSGSMEPGTDGLPAPPPRKQLGVVGTDLLSQLTVELAGTGVFLSAPPCPRETLSGHGLVPVAQTEFFSAASSNGRYPNVPVVFLQWGGVRTWAQIDTGYDDLAYAHSIDINETLFEHLAASGMTLNRLPDVRIETCEGLESRSVYTLDHFPLVIEDHEGQPIAQTQAYHLIVKHANGCGGIGSMTEQGAQLGASFLRTFGAVVFDPASETVWLTRQAGAP
jgi:hypothetical protein